MRQTQGNVALMFAIALPILMMITLGAIDLHQASKVKAELQDALDAAALAAARSIYADDANINRVGMAALKANMPRYFQAGSADTANFVLSNNRVTGEARVNVKVLVANGFLPPYGKLPDDHLPVGSRPGGPPAPLTRRGGEGLGAGRAQAAESIDSGAAARTLAKWVEVSERLAQAR